VIEHVLFSYKTLVTAGKSMIGTIKDIGIIHLTALFNAAGI
jgi:hypothetical protein